MTHPAPPPLPNVADGSLLFFSSPLIQTVKLIYRMPSSFACLSHQLWLGLLIAFAFHSSNVHSFQTITSIRPQSYMYDSSSGDDVTAATNSEGENAKISTQSITTMDDGGSDLTDRFKYKVSEEIKVEPPYGGIICLCTDLFFACK